MSEYQTIARPYAQAVFELAQASSNFQQWSEVLAWAAEIAADDEIKELVQNPRVERDALARLLEDILADRMFQEAKAFLHLVIHNRRVLALPNIASQFEAMRAEAEGTIEAELISALHVGDDQRDKLAQSLSQRLGREVSLQVTHDPQLIGGAVLRAGDLVIDASVKGRLQKLAANLAR